MDLITLETTIARAEGLLATELDGETVLMSLERGRYYGLERSAQRIWALLDPPCTVAALCRSLVDQYDVPPETCQREVQVFLERLLGEGLLVIPGNG